MIVSHWFACAWGLQTTFQDTYETTWFTEFGYCTRIGPAGATDGLGLVAAHSSNSSQAGEPDFDCRPPFALYVASLYWAVVRAKRI